MAHTFSGSAFFFLPPELTFQGDGEQRHLRLLGTDIVPGPVLVLHGAYGCHHS